MVFQFTLIGSDAQAVGQGEQDVGEVVRLEIRIVAGFMSKQVVVRVRDSLSAVVDVIVPEVFNEVIRGTVVNEIGVGFVSQFESRIGCIQPIVAVGKERLG